VNLLIALDAFNEAEFLAGSIRNGKFNFSAATGLFTPATNFGTFANLDNHMLQVSERSRFRWGRPLVFAGPPPGDLRKMPN
jgi:hypothetical protein